MTLLQEITEATRVAVRAFVEDRTDKEGRVSLDSLSSFARNIGFGSQPWATALKVGASPQYGYCPVSVSLLP